MLPFKKNIVRRVFKPEKLCAVIKITSRILQQCYKWILLEVIGKIINLVLRKLH